MKNKLQLTVEGKKIDFDDHFCLVWGEDTQTVTIKQRFGRAVGEAGRLAARNKGRRFYVMRAVLEFIDGEPLLGPTPIGFRRITEKTSLSLKDLIDFPQELLNEIMQSKGELYFRSFQEARTKGFCRCKWDEKGKEVAEINVNCAYHGLNRSSGGPPAGPQPVGNEPD